eukprot:195711_1
MFAIDLQKYAENRVQQSNENIFHELKYVSKLIKSTVLLLKKYHDSDLIHYDITPENIVILANKIGDNETLEFDFINFDNAKQNKCKLKTSFIGMNVQYAPPESYQQPSATSDSAEFIVSTKYDIYSLGISLLNIILGQHPYNSNINHYIQIQLIMKQYKNTVAPNFDFQTELNESVKDFVKWMKQKHINYGDNEQFVDLLNKMIQVNPETRYSIDQILTHKWFKQYC